MAIEFKCHNCQKTLRVADEFAGKKARCPNCQTILQVQTESETVEPTSVQPPLSSNPSSFPPKNPENSSASSAFSDNPYTSPSPQYQAPARRRSRGAPHRGGLVLGLGIAGLLCCIVTGILAFIFGMQDLKAMKEGRMDDEGHGLTLAGTILGGVGTALFALGVLLNILLLMLGGV